jgi:hypothetical protein
LKNLARKKETGLVKIIPKGGKAGEVYLKKGRPVHAVFGIFEGLEAIYALVRVESAEAVFEAARKPPKESIPKGIGINEILEQRQIRLDETRKRLPPFDTVLVKSNELPRPDSFALRKTDWQVLMLFDGRRNLTQIVERSRLPEETTLQSIDWLLETGLLIYSEANKKKE